MEVSCFGVRLVASVGLSGWAFLGGRVWVGYAKGQLGDERRPMKENCWATPKTTIQRRGALKKTGLGPGKVCSLTF